MSKTVGEKRTCRVCEKTFVPSFIFDFYPDGEDPSVGRCERCMMTELFKKPDPVSVTPEHAETVCKSGKGEIACSFLGLGEGGFSCLKKSSFESAIQERRRAGSIGAKGDNCSGPPDFKIS